MARIEDIYQPTRDAIINLSMPELPGSPWVETRPLAESRIALLTSAALHQRGEPGFAAGSAEFRELPVSLEPADMLMTHISINFDRTGFQRDINVAYPIDRLKEMAEDGAIGGLGRTHYSVMGSTDPAEMAETAARIAERLQQDQIDCLLLCPV